MTIPRRLPNLADVRYFVDEDLAGVGLAMMQLRNDIVVGSHAPVEDVIPSDDVDWIPVVAARGWVVITNDRHIRTRSDEAAAAVENGARIVHLKPTVRNPNRWEFVRLLARHWDIVEELAAESGPRWLQLQTNRYRYLEFRPGEPPRLPSTTDA